MNLSDLNKNSPESLSTWLKPTVEGLGYTLWGLQFARQSKQRLIRIFIDSDKGISVDNCAEASEQISTLLDTYDIYTEEYTLEVSSPGIDRWFFSIEQLKNYIGCSLKVKTKSFIDGRRRFVGLLFKVNGDILQLKIDGKLFDIDFHHADRVQLHY